MVPPIRRLQVAVALVSGLTALSLSWGSALLAAGPRLHWAALAAVFGVAALVLISKRNPTPIVRTTAVIFASIMFLAGVFLGAYDHLLKVVLVGHGLPDAVMASVIPPAFGPTGDSLYEALGIALLPLGLLGLLTLKGLTPKQDEE